MVGRMGSVLNPCTISKHRRAQELHRISGVEILAEPQLSIVAFRWKLNQANRDLLDRINGKKRIYLTGTMLDCPSPLPSPTGRGRKIASPSASVSSPSAPTPERMREGMEEIRFAIREMRDRNGLKPYLW